MWWISLLIACASSPPSGVTAVPGPEDAFARAPGEASATPGTAPPPTQATEPPVPASTPPATTPVPPTFSFEVSPIPDDLRSQMTGTSWRDGCPVGLDQLSLVRVSHWDMAGDVRQGELVVATAQAQSLRPVFSSLFERRFPIALMRPISHYGGDDDASMAADNTSAFNCRKTTGGSRWSEHSYGQAIDINPVENPYVNGATVAPPAGVAYTNRDNPAPGLISADSPVVQAFALAGWKWGGRWRRSKDYQHFSVSGR